VHRWRGRRKAKSGGTLPTLSSFLVGRGGDSQAVWTLSLSTYFPAKKNFVIQNKAKEKTLVGKVVCTTQVPLRLHRALLFGGRHRLDGGVLNPD
jgi:hypothetical protein